MKIEELKLYNKYRDIDYSNREYIYIGIDERDKSYVFLIENDYSINNLYYLCDNWGLDYNEIINNIPKNKNYDRKYFYSKEEIEKYLKPILKDKINNILNR